VQLHLAQNVSGERWEQIPSEVEYSEYMEIPDQEPVGLLSVMRGIVKLISSLLDEVEAAGC
jgi:hypothetical protein